MTSVIPDLENRKEVWLALSEFYLDTELTDRDLDAIADVFRQTGYPLKTIKEIDLYEVFPLLQANLLTPVGIWAGFDRTWLLAGCERQFRKRADPIYRLRCRCWNRLFYWMRRGYWQEIERLMH